MSRSACNAVFNSVTDRYKAVMTLIALLPFWGKAVICLSGTTSGTEFWIGSWRIARYTVHVVIISLVYKGFKHCGSMQAAHNR